METHFAFSVKAILGRDHFKCASVVAGHKGLKRLVKWVHVFEITEVRENLKGGELVLSTGFGWKEDNNLFISLLEQLIQRNVSGLCIELGSFIDTIPEEAVELANRHHFPIITFNKEVSFVEITQDIHADLINQQYELISNLEDYSQRLNKKLLSIDNSFEILKYLQQYLGCQLVYMAKDEQVIMIPAVNEIEKEKLLSCLNHSSCMKVISQPVYVFERRFATVHLLTKSRDFGEFESLLLDRTATALAQYLLRELYTEEKRKAEETEWMLEWLQGVHTKEEINEHLTIYKINDDISGAIVLIVKLQENHHLNTDITYLNMMIQNIFDQNGYFVFPVEKRHLLTFVLLNKEGEDDWKHRTAKGIERMKKILKESNGATFQIAGGKYVRKLDHVDESFKTAQETLSIQGKMPAGDAKHFYEDMHMYRLISLVHKHSNLQSLIKEYLDPILEYDQKHNTNLLQTLKVYLACNGSKKETAKKIFVVRQTLYHRLEKLEQLLGKDFMEAEKRQVIEFSILAHEYQQTILN
ncbi:PucR family transcriptional regulator [Halobacillus sp. Marseille-P3879]|uniref:PucR family transcriptional regulator n=1 Tax=Halobacillus sp. Marseille-P3879 TaxID=2045014 RepID=UPI000C7B08D6|nr:PucR family transcriptional regulator [Halobacillus sp. Marseille-P3879]